MRFNGIINIKHLETCLAFSKSSRGISYCIQYYEERNTTGLRTIDVANKLKKNYCCWRTGGDWRELLDYPQSLYLGWQSVD